MAKTEKALVMRDVPSPNGSDVMLHQDPAVALAQLVGNENISLRNQTLELHTLMVAGQNALVDQLKELREQTKDLFELKLQLLKEIQKSLDKEEERKLKREREEATTKLIEQAGHSVTAVLPVLLNKYLVGGSKIPEAPARMIQPLIMSLASDPERLAQLANILKPEEFIAFKAIVDAMPDLPSEPLREPETKGEETEGEPCDGLTSTE